MKKYDRPGVKKSEYKTFENHLKEIGSVNGEVPEEKVPEIYSGDFKEFLEKINTLLEKNYNEILEKDSKKYKNLNENLTDIIQLKKYFIEVYNIFVDSKNNSFYQVLGKNTMGDIIEKNNLRDKIFFISNFLERNFQGRYNEEKEEVIESIRFLFIKLNSEDNEVYNKTFEEFKKGWDIMPNIGKKFFDILKKREDFLKKEILLLEKEYSDDLEALYGDIYLNENISKEELEYSINKKIKLINKFLRKIEEFDKMSFADILEKEMELSTIEEIFELEEFSLEFFEDRNKNTYDLLKYIFGDLNRNYSSFEKIKNTLDK